MTLSSAFLSILSRADMMVGHAYEYVLMVMLQSLRQPPTITRSFGEILNAIIYGLLSELHIVLLIKKPVFVCLIHVTIEKYVTHVLRVN